MFKFIYKENKITKSMVQTMLSCSYVLLFSVRESGKYYVAKLFDLCRRLVRQQGQQLHKASLVDSPDDVFDLTLDDLHLAHYAQAAAAHLHQRRPSVGPPRRSSVREKNSMPDLQNSMPDLQQFLNLYLGSAAVVHCGRHSLLN